jgi:hypothetical protein
VSDETGRTDMATMTLDLLTEIRDKLANIEERQVAIEDRMARLIIDVHTVHDFQRVFAERLSIVEKFCVDLPLSTPLPRYVGGKRKP